MATGFELQPSLVICWTPHFAGELLPFRIETVLALRDFKMGTEFPNVFIRLYRYRPQRHSTPKENFVTEAFAILLKARPQLLRDFFRRFGNEDIPEDVQVDTQVLVNGACFDITVSNGKDFYFLIESKLDAAFGGKIEDGSDQLERYAALPRAVKA